MYGPLRPGEEQDDVGLALRARGWEAHLAGWGLDARIRRADGSVEELPAEAEPYLLQARAFLAAAAAGDPALLPCSFAEGVATLRLTRAIDLAAASGRPRRV